MHRPSSKFVFCQKKCLKLAASSRAVTAQSDHAEEIRAKKPLLARTLDMTKFEK